MTNVVSSSRIKSGLAWASCSCKKTAGSILGVAVIAVSFFESVVRDHSKDHSGDRAYVSRTRSPGSSYTNAMDSTLELTVFDELMEGGESGGVAVPDAVAGLSVEQRWWLAFTVLRRACEELAPLAGEDPGPWPLLAAEMLARGPVERLVSRWKAAPDRRHRARLVTEVRVGAPDETWIEIARRGQDEPIGRSRKVHAGVSRRGPDAPTWQGAGSATMALAVDLGGFQLSHTLLIADLDSLEPVNPFDALALTTEPQVPAVRVVHFSTSDPSRPADVELGWINGEPWRLSREHQRAWRTVGLARLPEVKQWWAASGMATLNISAVCMPEATRPSSGLDGRDLWVEVPLHPQVNAHPEPEQAVLDALQSAVRVAARRAKIAPLTLT
ncbi:hypothetical protein [Terracoccus luteus]|uniref:Uncharacterized protein n=1 Tax=Terracoccus luteus TaxID=53356 RepID=A0A839PP82_9MICO|nr:hypothetical protein [Terracoccus luteus]MBB2986098.1 hypothetical protein [Terracoccus luteus]MCP2171750.1 hypothetical protein [Terracoccus luteus]